MTRVHANGRLIMRRRRLVRFFAKYKNGLADIAPETVFISTPPALSGTLPKSDDSYFESAYKVFLVVFGEGWGGVAPPREPAGLIGGLRIVHAGVGEGADV